MRFVVVVHLLDNHFSAMKESFYENITKELEAIRRELEGMEEKMLDICDAICESCWKDFGSNNTKLFEEAIETVMQAERLSNVDRNGNELNIDVDPTISVESC
ncbi:hypothetical protein EG68_07091 [Paragonimus skrjabini miyazakii]|uniref:Uncharacterized protein n=1 Tax=Paragonimus skrjabini miyazakii TaxID=59628 RepID=A0A8S9YZH4_9TREM|nr:hypothetical protein EG68_07091 [Paragonimus skrjabini miyazakii]